MQSIQRGRRIGILYFGSVDPYDFNRPGRLGTPMTRRSRAREVALQLLFQRDHNSAVDRKVLDAFIEERLREPELRPFCRTLYDGIVAHLGEIDAKLAAAAENWRLPRMATVD